MNMSEENKAILLRPYDEEVHDCDRIFEETVRRIKKQHGYGIEIAALKKAYDRAKELHGKTPRISGELYLRHPLAAMQSLTRLHCNTKVLVAALLHDTLEDTDYKQEELRAEFGPDVADIVSAVTAIKAAEKEAEEEFSRLSGREQHDLLDRLTDAKLILSNHQREAFLVRFADREHNLATLSACKVEKQREKVEKTEAFLIPAAERLGMRYFEVVLKDYCMKYKNNGFESSTIKEQQIGYISVSGPAFSAFDDALEDGIKQQQFFRFPNYNPFARLRGGGKGGKEASQIEHRRLLLPYEIKCQIQEGIDFARRDVCLCEVMLTCEDERKEAVLAKFLDFYKEHLKPKQYFFELLPGTECSIMIKVTDIFENNYRIVIVPGLSSGLESYFIGDPNGERLTITDENSLADALRPKITVYAYSTYKGLRAFEQAVPRGATALDFAFIVSESLAMTVKSAQIQPYSGEKVSFTSDDYHYPLQTILNDGDVVHFVADYTPHAEAVKVNAKIEWFSYINTELARNCLISYFKSALNE